MKVIVKRIDCGNVSVRTRLFINDGQNSEGRQYVEWKENVIPKAIKRLKKRYPELYHELEISRWGWFKNAGLDIVPKPGFISDSFSNYEINVILK